MSMYMCLLQVMSDVSGVPGSALNVKRCLTAGKWDDICECILCYGVYDYGTIHATHELLPYTMIKC